MASIATVILKEQDHIETRLCQLTLERQRLISAGASGMSGRGMAGAMHGKTSAGQYTFHECLAGLRAEYIGVNGWELYYDGGLEGIVNNDLNVIVLVKTADRCCSDSRRPKTGDFGAKSEKVCEGASLFDHAGVDLPAVVTLPSPKSSNLRTNRFSVFYLLLDPEGRMELSMPVIEDSKIRGFIERIYLVQDSDLDPISVLPEDAPNDDDLIIDVKRKNGK
ncbi:hypothetical protein E4Z66_18995 [Aliishimia ponticola]|uniref:Uncharacterized protein n=1 Tax=Aliishimia ponticola TaxID=2499833 RepID=A0A4S4N7K5_9RHOB|nr:hypothetical protein [Aliishimia ponticola]THH34287.1 hypothetical protein E4Z66_18995 [Aliishimia ponticola]